jgi:hypothetical protein
MNETEKLHWSVADRATRQRKINDLERHAVGMATAYLWSLGWADVEDVGTVRPFDLVARRPGRRLFVEVKGRQSRSSDVRLTESAVVFHADHYPDTALIVVDGIKWSRWGAQNVTSGGDLMMVAPFDPLDEERMRPSGYLYSLIGNAERERRRLSNQVKRAQRGR